MNTIFSSLAPNLQNDDFWLSLKLLFSPMRWKYGDGNKKLQSKLLNFLGAKHAVFFESGRSSLLAILKAIGLKNGDAVLLQAFTCVAVPNSVLWAGLKPVYVDIEENGLNMSVDDFERKITSSSKAVIVQHTFGIPANIEKITEIARRHNLFIIEDCAHALGMKSSGKFLGTFGDASFFSFGRDKMISSVFGGAVVTSDDGLFEKINSYHADLKIPGNGWIFQQIFYNVVMFFVKKLYDIFIGKIILYLSRTLSILSKPVYPVEKNGLMPDFVCKQFPNALAELALNQLNKIENFNSHRLEISSQYAAVFKGAGVLRFATQVNDPNFVLSSAKNDKIFLGDWYNSAIAPKGVNFDSIGYNPSACKNAELVAKKVINLPTDINISKNDATRIIQSVQRAVEQLHK